MHGRVNEESKKALHMWTEPTLGNSAVGVVAAVAADDSTSNSLLCQADNSFLKDGRRISVGDCALFKPPQDSPPFIGIIRWLAPGKENQLKLCVNWLYRPAEVKLGKGIQLEAAPNEVFYSFHKDEIPAASLLHPCKVAFLAKGVELPLGISSFVCRRVYDITNKCLWWLTDQDYINERQEEVDNLLCKTRLEMNATVQQGGRSSKPMNGPTSTSQLKPSSDSLHTNASSFASQVKGKKRERLDQGSEPVKRDRSSKMDDSDFVSSRPESIWISEISRFTEKGALVDSEGVEKLVQLMQPERNDKKIDLIGRSLLASVVAATEKHDCLTRFVQLRGLPVFDEWLQEVHKGKVGDGNVMKDGDKSVEEFLLVLLRALDKIPVDLHALQMCNIGKSVNHLRTHKNLEIQKKARSLVDTWKKGVEAEMDAKSGSNQAVPWPARARLPEVSHSGNRHSVTSSEVAVKSSSGHISAVKNISFKVVQGEATAKSATPSPVSVKSTPPLPLGINVKEGQPQYTCANGGSDSPLAAAGDEKSSSSSQSHNNSQSCSSDHAKTGGYSVKEDARSSTAISMTTNKITGGSSQHRKSMNGFSGPTSSVSQKEAGSGRNSSSYKNPGSLPNSTLTCEKAVDVKEVLTGSVVTDGSPSNLCEEDNTGIGDETRKLVEIPKASAVSFGIECKSVKSHESAFSSINALVESCVKYSEANASISVGDNVGMNLLASVAAGEMSKSNAASPCPAQRIVSGRENSCTSAGLRMKSSPGDELIQDQGQSFDDEHKMEATTSCDSPVGNKEDEPNLKSQEQPTAELNGNLNLTSIDVQQVAESCTHINVESEQTPCTSFPSASKIEMTCDGGVMESCGKLNACDLSDAKEDLCTSFQNEEKVNCLGGGGTKVVDGSSPAPSVDADSDKKSKIPVKEEQKPVVMMQSGCSNGKEVLQPTDCGKSVVYGSGGAVKYENTLNTEVKCESTVKRVDDNESPGMQKIEMERNLDSSNNNCMESVECGQGKKEHDCSPMPSYKFSQSVVQESDQQEKSKGSKLAGNENDEAQCTSAAAPPAAVEPDVVAKLEFDLNEGFNGDDGKFEELNNSRIPECSTGIQLLSPLAVSSASNGLPASITVSSAAKRPFIPPEDLLKIRGELGWKGSAATSAFRPAEPRKSLETRISNTSVSLPDLLAAKPSHLRLDIDLNIPDERILEDMACQSTCHVSGSVPDLANKNGRLYDGVLGSASVQTSSGLDLDLNRVDEPADFGNHLTSSGSRLDIHSDKLASTGLLGVCRDFDLNDGPLDELNRESSSFSEHTRNNVQSHSQLSISAIKVNNGDMVNFSSWFSPMSAVNIQPIIPDRGEQPFPVVGPAVPQRLLAPAGTLFTPDVYHGSVLSSSPNMPFASTPFQYPLFPFGTSFPLPSATCSGGSATYVDSSAGSRLCFPGMSSQVLAPFGAVQSHYPSPFSGRLDGNSSNAESNRKWGKQGLDLNAGPQCPEMEGRDDISSLASRHLSVGSSQALAQEQSRIYQVSGGSVLKRKEPDGGGWESYKQSSWQ